MKRALVQPMFFHIVFDIFQTMHNLRNAYI